MISAGKNFKGSRRKVKNKMSVVIDPSVCLSCGKCVRVCPGSLLAAPHNRAARILYPSDCWGCASCIKVCGQGAIALALPPSLGGRGGRLTARERDGVLEWKLTRADGGSIRVLGSSGEPGEY